MKINPGIFRSHFFYTCLSIFMAFVMAITLLPHEIIAQDLLDNSTNSAPIEDNATVPEPVPTDTPEPRLPSISTMQEAQDITSSSALIGCKLVELGSSENVTVSLVYGEARSYGFSTESQLLTNPAEVTFQIGDLKPETAYYFKAIAITEPGEVYGEESQFTTLAEFNPAPIETPVPTPEYVLPEIKTDSEVTEITSTSAVLQGSVISLGSEKSVKVYFEYGEDDTYAFSSPPQELEAAGIFSVVIQDLKPETTYYFRGVAAFSTGIIFGESATVKTLPIETAEPTPPPINEDNYSKKVTIEASPDKDNELISPDGKVALKLPKGAVDNLTTIEFNEMPVYKSTGTQMLNLFQLNAASTDSKQKITRFSKDLEITIQHTDDDFSGLDTDSLCLYYFDETTRKWSPVKSCYYDQEKKVLKATTDHFTRFGEQIDQLDVNPGRILAAGVNLHLGSATYSYPIDLPTAPGGFQPKVELNYNSAVVDEMKNRQSVGSWVGIGWTLHLGRISLDLSAGQYFLDLNGASYQLCTQDGVNFYTNPEVYFKIIRDENTWEVWDKSGNYYRFGGTSDSEQYTYNNSERKFYRWDLSLFRDTNSNQADISYIQSKNGSSPSDFVRSAFPEYLRYDNNSVEVHFISNALQERGDCGLMRADNPYNPDSTTSHVPKIMDTRQLDTIEIKVSNILISKYIFGYTTTSAAQTEHYSGFYTYAGKHKLDSIVKVGADGTSPLPTSVFHYTNKSVYRYEGGDGDYVGNPGNPADFAWPYLTSLDSGYGGSITFTYTQKPDEGDEGEDMENRPWTRQIVTQKTMSGGIGVDHVSYYEYSTDADLWPQYDCDGWDQKYLGFGEVKEIDSGGNYTKHYYYTSENQKLSGYEYKTEWYDSSSNLLKQIVYHWSTLITSREPIVTSNWGRAGSDESLLQGAKDICVSSNGFVYVIDVYEFRVDGEGNIDYMNVIKKFDLNGEYNGKFGSNVLEYTYSNMALEGNNHAYISCPAKPFDDNILSATPPSSGVWYNYDCNGPTDIAVAENGTLFIIDASENLIVGNGTSWSSTGDSLAVSSDNRIFVAYESGNYVQIYNSNGVSQGTFGTGHLSSPVSIDISDTGYVYVLNQDYSIEKFYDNGTFIHEIWGYKSSGSLSNAKYLAVGPDNTIFLRKNSGVSKIDFNWRTQLDQVDVTEGVITTTIRYQYDDLGNVIVEYNDGDISNPDDNSTIWRVFYPYSSDTFGLTSGNNTVNKSANTLEMMRFQNTCGDGTLTSLELKFAQAAGTGNVKLGIYSDYNGAPYSLLLDAGSVAAGADWVRIDGLNLQINQNTYYWLAFILQNQNTVAYQSGQPANSHAAKPCSFGAFPPSIGDVQTYDSNQFVMRATVSTPPGILNKPARERVYSGTITSDLGGSDLNKESVYYYDNGTDVSHNDMNWQITPVKGNLTRIEQYKDASNSISTYYTYDNYGNVLTEQDPNGNITATTYDDNYHMYPVTKTYPITGLSESYTYDPGTTNLLSKTDVNGQTTSYQYDTFKRLIKEIKPGDNSTSPSTEYQYNDWGILNRQSIKTITKTGTSPFPSSNWGNDQLSNWMYRKSLVLSRPSGAITNYQIKLTVHYGSGTDSGADVYCNSQCQSDFDDLRFTTSDGATFLDYWIETYTASSIATVWVEFDSISTTGTNFYMYYGNQNANSVSNGANTFSFFDDFSGATLDTNKWNAPGGSYSVSGGNITLTNGWQALSSKENASSLNGRWRSRAALTNISNEVIWGISTTGNTHGAVLDFYGGALKRSKTMNGSNATNITISGADTGMHNWEIILNCPTDVKVCMDETLKNTHTATLPTAAQQFIGVVSGSTANLVVDWVFYAQYLSSEPAWGNWGTEETSLSNWNYRKSIILDAASGSLSNYQIKLTVHYGSGEDSGADVYCNSHSKSDFSDLRFTTSDGATLLDYWIDEYDASSYAVVWVECDSISSLGSLFYMYYGNASAGSASNGTNTFILFEDFERGSNGDTVGGIWSTTGSSTTISTEQAFGGTRSVKIGGTSPYSSIYKTLNSIDDNSRVYFRFWKADNVSNSPYVNVWGNDTKAARVFIDSSERVCYYYASSSHITGSECVAEEWQSLEIRNFNWTDGKYDIYLNSSLAKSEAQTTTYSGTAEKLQIMNSQSSSSRIIYLDNIVVCNYSASEPTWRNWGQEESQVTNTLWKTEYFDGLGRVVQTHSNGENGHTTITGTTVLDSRGLTDTQYVTRDVAPDIFAYQAPDASWKYNSYSYDALGRTVSQTNADGITVSSDYSASWQTLTTDQNGHKKRNYYDAFNHLIKVDELSDNLNWGYRKPITLSRASGAVTNYQMKLTVHYGSGADSGADVYCNSHCKADFSDLRFTTSDGMTLLDYWIESKIDSNNAVVWIKFDTIGTGATTFYLYYGNSAASSVSNGSKTFSFFDDFIGSSLDTGKWSVPGGSYSVSGGIVTLTNGSQSLYSLSAAPSLNGRLRTKASLVNPSNEVDYGLTNSIANNGAMLNFPSGSFKTRTGDGTTSTSTTLTGGNTSQHIYEIDLNCPTNVKFYVDDTLKNTMTANLPTAAQTFRGIVKGSTAHLSIDWIFFSQFLATEPSWGNWGSEEITSAYSTTNYSYDILGNLTDVYDDNNNHTHINYNRLSQKDNMTDPDMGYWSYVYDGNGNLTSQTDAENQTIEMTYDALNRLTAKTYPAGSGMTNIGYTYDSTAGGNYGKGKKTGMTDASGTGSYEYDNRGRLIQEIKTIDSAPYTTSYTYDGADRVVTITYPVTGEVITNTYNGRGLPETLSGSSTGSLVSGTLYNALGSMVELNLGNSTRTTFGYYGMGGTYDTTGGYYGRLWEIKTAKQPGSTPVLQDVKYTWDTGGNLTQRENIFASETENFTYDFLDRLTGVSGPYSESFSYNQIGNITTKDGANYAYGAKPHAVTQVGNTNYTYDSNGNMLTDDNGTVTITDDRTILWDVENRPKSVTKDGVTTTYVYDGDGSRVKASGLLTNESFEIGSPPTGWNANGVTLSADSSKYVAGSKSIKVISYGYQNAYQDLSPANVAFCKGRTVTFGAWVWCSTPNTAGLLMCDNDDYEVSSYHPGDSQWHWLTMSFTPWSNASLIEVELYMRGAGTAYFDGASLVIGSTIAQTTPDNLNSILYVNKYYEKNITNGIETYNYYFGSRLIAVKTGAALSYIMQDHLGSTSGSAAANGTLTGTISYFSFGAIRFSTGPLPTDKKFTGQRLDSTGLYYYNARYFDPEIGRFISPDTMVPNPANPQSLNRYSYCRNNPLKYTDPTGHMDNYDLGLPDDWDDYTGYRSRGGDLAYTEWEYECEQRRQGLNVISMIPFVGIGADIQNGRLSVESGDNLDAALCFAGVVPFIGDLADFVKWAKRYKNIRTIEELYEMYPELKGVLRTGKLGGPGHRATVADIVNYFDARKGFKVVSEQQFNTFGGAKAERFGDLFITDTKTGEQLIVQVGVGTKSREPIARERQALDDLRRQGYHVEFIPYN